MGADVAVVGWTGTQTATGWAGSVDGAVRSRERVAAEVAHAAAG